MQRESDILQGLAVLGRHVRFGNASSSSTSLIRGRSRERSLAPPWRLQLTVGQDSPVEPSSSDRVRCREMSIVNDAVRGRERSLSPSLSSRRARKKRKSLEPSSDDSLLAPCRRGRRSPTADAPVHGRGRSILPPSDALNIRREEFMRRSPNAPPERVTPIPNLANVQNALQWLMDATVGRDLSFANPHFVDRGPTDALIYFPIQDGLQKVAQEALDVYKAGRVELYHGTTPLSCITILKSGSLKKMDQDGVVLTNDLLACRNSHYNKGVILRCDAYIQNGQPDNYNTVAKRAESDDWRSQYLSEAGHALHQRDGGFSKIWVNERSVEIRGLYVALKHWESIWAAWNRFISKTTRRDRRCR
jgi:hypothetical protein